MRVSFDVRWERVGIIGGEVGVIGRPRRDSRFDRRDDRADN